MNSPPVIILGGGANALSIARSLGRAGVKVYALNHRSSYVGRSRYCTWLPCEGTGLEKHESAWQNFLLGAESARLAGSVLLAANDDGLEILANNRPALEKKFILDISNPPAQLAMLNKLETFRLAHEAGILTPRHWVAQSQEQIHKWRHELVYPLLVKPLYSHVYERLFQKKFATVRNFDELLAAYAPAQEAGIDVMLVELIPGPDDRLCSYYTYLDETGAPQFDFTKRVIRRYPIGMGNGCYHITDWVPEAKELGLKFFRHVGLRGLANVEFKLDVRDGQLKLIECNARFTAANGLVADSGMDLALFVYNRLTGRPQQPLTHFTSGKRLWYPLEDYNAFRKLRNVGQLSFGQWLKSVAHPQTLPVFRWYDPMPTLHTEGRRLGKFVSSRWNRLVRFVSGRDRCAEKGSDKILPSSRGLGTQAKTESLNGIVRSTDPTLLVHNGR